MENNITYKHWLVLMKAMVRIVSYHNGYAKMPVKEKTVVKYLVTYRESTCTGVNVANVFKTVSTNSRLTNVANLQQQFPKFLHSLFWYSSKVLGLNATVPQLVDCMNSQAAIRFAHCPI